MKHVFNVSGLALYARWEHRGNLIGFAKKDSKGGSMRIRHRRVFLGIALTLAAGLAPAQDLRLMHFF
jgi:hypothetical protein